MKKFDFNRTNEYIGMGIATLLIIALISVLGIVSYFFVMAHLTFFANIVMGVIFILDFILLSLIVGYMVSQNKSKQVI